MLGRVGVDYPGAPPPVLPAISSTEVRAKLADDDADLGPVAELVPKAVIEYARARRLYSPSKD